MSDTDFQERLRRVNANNRNPSDHRPRRPRFARLLAGSVFTALGLQALKHMNENYEVIRDELGLAATAAIGLLSLAGLLFGGYLIGQAVLNGFGTPRPIAQPGQARTPSSTARAILTLIGLILGCSAMLLMFMAGAAQHIDTQAAEYFQTGGVLLSFVLVIIATLFGIVGIFLRGHGLWHTPIYFLFGAGIVFAVFKTARINLLGWERFVSGLQ